MNKYKMYGFFINITLRELRYLIELISIAKIIDINLEFDELKRDIQINIRKLQIIKNMLKSNKHTIRQFNKKIKDFHQHRKIMETKMHEYEEILLDNTEENE